MRESRIALPMLKNDALSLKQILKKTFKTKIIKKILNLNVDFNSNLMYNEFIKIKTNYISHANIYSTRNFGSIFFALFSGCCGIPACHSERKRRVFEGAGFLFEDSVCCVSALPQRQTVCRMTIFEGVILSVSEISLCKKVLDPSLCSG